MTTKRIIYTNNEGGISIIVPAKNVEECIKDIPEGADYEIVTTDKIPSDRTFRAGWKRNGKRIEHDVEKCKEIAHQLRREVREEEFKPFDEAIAKQIPGKKDGAEEERQKIRDKYAKIQQDIDTAGDISVLYSVCNKLKGK